MKRLLLLPLVAVLVAASTVPALAQVGMNLAWNNCITQSNAAADKAYACDGSLNGTPFKIVFSFFTPVALPEFVGIEATFDIQSGQASLPDWWRLNSGECRAMMLNFPGGLSGVGTGTTGACQNPWASAQTGGGYRWWSESDGDSNFPGAARLRVAMARDAWSPTSLSTNQQYVGGVILLESLYDVMGEDSLVCSGCSTPVCIVLNEVKLMQNSGASGGDIQTITTAETRQYITWQGGPTGGCATQPATPARLWGSIRAVLR